MTNQSATPGEVRSSEQLGATTRKRYPLEVEGGQTDDGAYCMSKGHHDKAVFLAEARLWWGDEVQGWTEPEHKWLRVVPDPNEEWRRGLLMDAKPHSRGAFPATWTESRSAITQRSPDKEARAMSDEASQSSHADEGPVQHSVGRPAPKRFVGGRIVGGCSLHAAHNPNLCQPYHHRCPEPRTVDCCGVVDEHDIVECSHCGKQWTVPCNFDEDYS